jgi:SAM-dependent methyltransferase
MKTFDTYAAYYDLLYHDKNYAAEVDYVDGLIKKSYPQAKTILDLGCGSGNHAFLFTQKGYHVHGIDISQLMIDCARAKQQVLDNEQSKTSFSCADLRTVSLDKTFDVVVSLFHVMSYQTSQDDLQKAFATAYKHLAPGGLFIFDCWYGPAVLADQPRVRVKRMENEQIKIVRIAEPILHPNNNYVDVQFTVYIHPKGNTAIDQLHETHCMRYLFEPEVRLLYEAAGFDFVAAYEWLGDRVPALTSWNVCFIGKK